MWVTNRLASRLLTMTSSGGDERMVYGGEATGSIWIPASKAAGFHRAFIRYLQTGSYLFHSLPSAESTAAAAGPHPQQQQHQSELYQRWRVAATTAAPAAAAAEAAS